MNKTSRSTAASLALACWLSSAIVSASDFGSTEPELYWRMDFGAPKHAPSLGYGFALRHAGSETQRALPALVQLDVSQAGALARFAGIPLSEQSFRRDQTDGSGAVEPAATTPWYARQWVWWTGAGVAATAAVATGGGSDNGNNPGGPNDPDNGPGGILCSDGSCVIPCNSTGPVINTCNDGSGFTAEHVLLEIEIKPGEAWLSEGTGQMGDLIGR